jgi:hypothetical protein
VAFGIAVGSTLLMAVLSVVWNMPGQADASRLYFGTDTHAMGLLVGAALAAFYRPGAMPRSLPRTRQIALSGVGLAATVVVLLAYVNVTEQGSWLYRGGFLVFSLATAAMIAVVAHPASMLGGVFGNAPMRYIGTRSYGLYLYHWPIFVVLRPEVDVPMGHLGTFVLRVVLTFAVAEVSYRFLEMPIRRGTAWPAVKRWFASATSPSLRIGIVAASATAVTVAVTAVIVTASAPTAEDYLGGRTEVNAAPLATAEPSAEATAGAEPTAAAPEPSAPPSEAITATTPMTVVGDSLAVGAADGLVALMPATTVDAAVSRQATEVFDRVTQRRAAGQLDAVVVIQTGTNGVVEEDQLRAALEQLSDRQRVVLVTSHGPHWWQAEANEVLTAVGGDFPNVRIADFAGASAGRSDYFVEDGIHLTQAGLAAYTQLITQVAQTP